MSTQLTTTPENISKMEMIYQAVEQGEKNLNTPLMAYSDKTPIEIYEISKKIFNIYKLDVAKEVEDMWKTDSRRPTSRNKTVVVIAHLINELIVPSVKAQTRNSKHDEKAARIMRDLLDYVQQKSRYRREMLFTLMEAACSPAAVVRVGYQEAWKTERYYDADGNLRSKQVVDDIISGFYMKRLRFSNFLVNDINETDIQEQDWVIERDLITEQQAKSKYKGKANIDLVKPGVYFRRGEGTKVIEDVNVKKISERGLIEVINYYNRGLDMHVTMLNGVIIDDKPIQRMDKRYPFAHLGYEPITAEAEFFCFPLIMKLKEDQELLEESFNIIMDGMKLDAKPPTIVNRRIGRNAFIPGSYTVSDDGFKSQELIQGRNSSAGLSAAQLLESSMDETSSASLGGKKAEGEQSRYQFQVLSDNAMAPHGLFKSLIREFVVDVTQLQVSDIIQYTARPALNKLVEGVSDIDTIVIPKTIYKNKAVDKEIRFVNPISSLQDNMKRSYEIYKEQKNTRRQIAEVNPLALVNMAFSVYADPELAVAENKAEKIVREKEMFMLLRQDPHVDQQALIERYVRANDVYAVEDLIKDKSEVEKIMKQQQAQDTATRPKQMGGADNAPRLPTV